VRDDGIDSASRMRSRRYRSSAACWSMSAMIRAAGRGIEIKMNFRWSWVITVALKRSIGDRLTDLGDEMELRGGIGESIEEKTGFTHVSWG